MNILLWISFKSSYINKLRESMGATEDDEELLIRDVEIPNTLNIAAAYNQTKVIYVLP